MSSPKKMNEKIWLYYYGTYKAELLQEGIFFLLHINF